MKFADRLKFTASGTSAATLTAVSAAPKCRTLSQVLLAPDNPFSGTDTNVGFTIEDGTGNWETSYYTIGGTASAPTLTRSRVFASSNNGQAVTFDGNGLTVTNVITSEHANSFMNPDDVGFDIVLLIGQSNMAGRGVVDTYADVANSRVFQYGGDSNNANTYKKIVQAVDPLSHAENASTAGTGVGPGMPFARAYAASIPSNRHVLLVPCAVGSTALVNGPWAANAGSNYLTQAISQAQAALAAANLIYSNNRIVGALWAQGEQDANNGVSAATYDAALQALISEVRTNLSAPNMWFMIHGMNPDYVATYPAYQAIQTALQNVATEVSGCMFVAGPTGSTYDNSVHYTSAGYRILGAKSASLVAAAKRYKGQTLTASALTVTASPASVASGAATTVTVSTDHPLTGSQTVTATLAAPVAGAWSAGTSVTLSASTTSVSQTFTPSATGSGNITATQASGTPTVSAGSAALTVTAAATETLTVNTPATQTAGTAFTVSGTYANVTPTALDYSLDGGTTWTAAASPTIGSGNYSFGGVTVASANASQTVMVRDHNNTSVTATSAAFTVSATPTESLTVNTPATQTVGVAYNVTGTYANGTPTALDYSIDGGTTWTAATSPTISGGNYSFSVTPTTSAASRTMMVRDHNNTGVTATSGTYTVNAAAAATTWDPANANAHIVLTASNLQANTTVGTANGWEAVRSTTGKSAGKWYWETKNLTAANVIVGIGDSTTSLSNYPGASSNGNSYSYYSTGSTFHSVGSSSVTAAAYTTNDVIGHALDMDNKTYQLFKNGVSQGTFTGLPAVTMYAMMAAQDGSPAPGVLANFGGNTGTTPFAYTPPTGFSALQ